MNNDASSALSTLLSNPDALSKISQIISRHLPAENRDDPPLTNELLIKNSNETQSKTRNDTHYDNSSPTVSKEKSEENTADIPDESKSQRPCESDQLALLLAIRPYLSPRRKEMIDGFIRLSKMGSIFKNFI